MCGIAGLVGSFAPRSADSAVAAMLAAQVHRGPDDGGHEVLQVGANVVGLGNRRLAILDLSPLGHQPMTNPSTGDVLVYNGELYNFVELRHELESHGHTFRGNSDTEVLLHAWQQWGAESLDRLRGMFSFALWDARRGRLVLARDHLGIKPLYLAQLPGQGLVFASELRALFASGLLTFAVDRRGLAGYLAYGAAQEPLTIAEGVRTLGPGHWAEFDPDGRAASQRQWWDFPRPEPSKRALPLAALLEEGRALLDGSVRRHLRSDVPLGVFLSSGLDSTAVLATTRRVSTGEVHAFTVVFPDEPDFDEGPIARDAARRLGVTHHRCEVDGPTSQRWALAGLDAMDQPAMDGLNTYIVSRAVREQNLVVALSGQGGDEVFAGYSTFRRVPRWRAMLRLADPLPARVRSAGARLGGRWLSRVARAKVREMAELGSDLAGLYFLSRRLLSNDELEAAGLAPASLQLDRAFQTEGASPARCVVAGDDVASLARLESGYYLRNTLLRDGDVFSMASSIEVRVPFLDRDLVDWAFRLTGDVLLPRGAPNKFLLRKLCGDAYSPDQARQVKRGFTLPIRSWLLGPLREVMDAALEQVAASGLIERAAVGAVRDGFLREPKSPAWSRVWGLVALGHWLRRRPLSSAPST